MVFSLINHPAMGYPHLWKPHTSLQSARYESLPGAVFKTSHDHIFGPMPCRCVKTSTSQQSPAPRPTMGCSSHTDLRKKGMDQTKTALQSLQYIVITYCTTTITMIPTVLKFTLGFHGCGLISMWVCLIQWNFSNF